VVSTGTDTSGRKRRVVATIGAESLFSDAFFTTEGFGLTGTQEDSPVGYRSSQCDNFDPRLKSGGPCILSEPIPAWLGTNGTISGSDATAEIFKQRWEGFNMYGRTNQADADQACMEGRCGTAPKVAAITERKLIHEDKLTAPGNATCPFGGNIGANGTTTILNAGDYTCPEFNLKGTIQVAGSGTVRLWPTRNFSVAPGSVVNRAQPPARFQVYFAPQKPSASGSICDAEIWALLYTPGLTIDCKGSKQPKIFGAVVAKVHNGTGTGNHFNFHWDADSVDAVHTNKYVIRNWRECPATVNDC
jgi:hypothetical protein